MISRSARIRRRWWTVYAVGVLLTLAAMVIVTHVSVSLESSANLARAEASRHEALRLALWRLDSWISPLIAREAGRPYTQYQAASAGGEGQTDGQTDVQTGWLPPEWGAVATPLRDFESEYVALHFQVNAAGIVTSPQVIMINSKSGGIEPGSAVASNRTQLLADLQAAVSPTQFAEQVRDVEACVSNVLENRAINSSPPPPQIMQQQQEQEDANNAGGRLAQSRQGGEAQQSFQTSQTAEDLDYWKRANIAQKLQFEDSTLPGKGESQSIPLSPAEEEIEIGPFVPLWIRSANETAGNQPATPPLLAFVRRVRNGSDEIQQGFLMNWENVSHAMRDEIADVFPDALIEPLYEGWATEHPPDLSLALLPAVLHVPPIAASVGEVSPTTVAMLSMAWIAVFGAVSVVGFAMYGGLRFGEKRSRFASAVTHELRTPLTTFRMYSEMLAQRMVPEDQAGTYLDTLDREARRLESLVNNVLAYARLEEGRHRTDGSRTMTIVELVERCEPMLRRRCEDAGVQLDLQINVDESTSLRTDPEAVGQILFNLVENACKYGRNDVHDIVHMIINSPDEKRDQLAIRVADRGPGIDGETKRRLFQPFERGAGDPNLPGIGLGLALSRNLARDLGGDLVLLSQSECQRAGWSTAFELRLPVNTAPHGRSV